MTQIADALEETEEKISRIVEIAQKYAPEYDERKTLDEVMGYSMGCSTPQFNLKNAKAIKKSIVPIAF